MRHQKPRVTVMMPVYNGAPYLQYCLASLWNQSFEDFELLVMDDGSTDETPAILNRVRDDRLRVIRLERTGIPYALNLGLQLANGDYVAQQDVDDLSTSDRLMEQVQFLDSHSDIGLVGSGVTVVNCKGHELGVYLFQSRHTEIVRQFDQLVNPIPHTTIMYRKQAVLQCGGYRELFPKAHDYDLFLRLSETRKLAGIRKPLCRLMHRMDSVTFGDSEGQAFRESVLAFLCSLSRRQHGTDPMEGDAANEFLASFLAWYGSSHYPDFYRGAALRRQTRLFFSEGHLMEAGHSLITAISVYPNWFLQKLRIWRADREALEARNWMRDRLRGANV